MTLLSCTLDFIPCLQPPAAKGISMDLSTTSLNWLPVNLRIRFKILLITYKGLHNCSPVYIKEIFTLQLFSSYRFILDHLLIYQRMDNYIEPSS